MKVVGKIAVVVLLFEALFGIGLDDSLWVHIEDLKPGIEAGKVKLQVQWAVYASSKLASSYGDWYLVEDTHFVYVAQCATDSLFKHIVEADTVEGNNVVFSGLELDRLYYLRALIVGTKNPSKSDFATGGYFKKYAAVRSRKTFEKKIKQWIGMGIGVGLIVLGGVFMAMACSRGTIKNGEQSKDNV